MVNLWSIVIFLPLDNKEQSGKNNCHNLCNYNRNPNTVNPPKHRQKDNGSRLKEQCPQERDNRGSNPIVERCEKKPDYDWLFWNRHGFFGRTAGNTACKNFCWLRWRTDGTDRIGIPYICSVLYIYGICHFQFRFFHSAQRWGYRCSMIST